MATPAAGQLFNVHASLTSVQHMQPLHAANGEQAVVFIDQGRFGFTEFSAAHGPSSDALAVTGGVHVVEVVPSELACRALTFPALDPALKVPHLRVLAFLHSLLSARPTIFLA